MSDIEDIKREARQMILVAVALRREAWAKAPPHDGLLMGTPITAAELARAPRPRFNPGPEPSIHRAYEAALRFWAQRAAKQITFDEWQDMAHGLADEMQPSLNGDLDVISFLEVRFDELRMKDGKLVLR